MAPSLRGVVLSHPSSLLRTTPTPLGPSRSFAFRAYRPGSLPAQGFLDLGGCRSVSAPFGRRCLSTPSCPQTSARCATREVSPVAWWSFSPFRSPYAGGCRKIIGRSSLPAAAFAPWFQARHPRHPFSTRQVLRHVADRRAARPRFDGEGRPSAPAAPLHGSGLPCRDFHPRTTTLSGTHNQVLGVDM